MSFTSVINKAISTHQANVAARQQRKIERAYIRSEKRQTKFLAKYGSKAVAYEHGINPSDSLWGGITGVANAAAGGVSGAFGGTYLSPTGGGSGNTTLLLVGGAAVVVILLIVFSQKS